MTVIDTAGRALPRLFDHQIRPRATSFFQRLGGAAMIAAISVICLTTGSAVAQTNVGPPPTYQAVDRFGVDLKTGALQISSPAISVGDPDDGGLSFVATFDGGKARAWRYSNWGGINKAQIQPDPYCYAFYTVTFMGKSILFRKGDGCGGWFEAIDGLGTLVRLGDIYTYTAPDGTIVKYDYGLRIANGPYLANEGRITSIEKPNGEIITYTYAGSNIQSVSNNFGYQLHFDYTQTASPTLSKVTALNNAVDGCAPTDATCTYSTTWPSLTFTTVGAEYHVTDALNRTTRIIYDSTDPINGKLVGVARPTRTSGSSLTFTQERRPPVGEYKVTTASDGVGVWAYEYEHWPCPAPPQACPEPIDDYTLKTTVIDPYAGKTAYTYNYYSLPFSEGQRLSELVGITNALGQNAPLQLNGSGLLSVAYPEGNAVGNTPDPATGVLVASGRGAKPGSGLTATSTTYAYPACTSNPVVCRRPTTITDPRGVVTSYSYDARGNVLTETRAAPTPGAVQPQIRYTYEDLYAWFKRAAGSAITQASSPVSRLVKTSQCTTSATCTGLEQEIVTTTAYQVGGTGQASNLMPVSVSSGAGNGSLTATTSMAYDFIGNVLTIDGPLSGASDTMRNVFDAMRQQVGGIGPDPDGAGGRLYPATRTVYNADGQPLSTEQGTTTGQTDVAWAAFSPLQTATTNYDPQGRKTVETTAAGTADAMLIQYEYDLASRLKCTAQRMNPSVFGSLPGACMLGTAGAFGPDRITFNTYDAADRLKTVTDGYGTGLARAVLTQDHTLNGQVDWVEDARGNRSDYTYDGFDRLSRVNYPTTTISFHAANPADYVEYGYDANDNLVTRRTRNNQLFTTTYDALNRPTGITAPANVGNVSATYDNLGRRLGAVLSTGSTVGMTWDALSRQRTETGPLGTISMDYDLADRRTHVDWPGAAFFVTYDWDLDNQMKAVRLSGTTQIAGFSYDNLGRRSQLSRPNGVTTIYGYDAASRMTSLSQDLPGSAWDQTYTLARNPAGQIMTRGSSNPIFAYPTPAAITTPYQTNGLNQAGLNGSMLPYDAKGNLLGNAIKAFTYDQANKLRSVQPSGGPVTGTLSYDPMDRLSVLTGTQGATYAYAGSGEIAALANTGSLLNNRFIRGPWSDEILVSYAGTTGGSLAPSWWLHDPQGSTIGITGATGDLGAVSSYDEYGRPAAGNTPRFQYTGQLYLPDFGVYHYKARAYDPALGRFLQTDPIGYDDGLNLYAYAANNPPNATDPTGKISDPVSGITVTAASPDDGSPDLNWLTRNDSSTFAQRAPTPMGPFLRFGTRMGSENRIVPRPSVPYPPDPTKPPGPGWEWRPVGTPPGISAKGNWYNPKTGESLHPDKPHGPHGRHMDYSPGRGQNGRGQGWRWFPDGRMEPKVVPAQGINPGFCAPDALCT